jgi:hypothetical protein
VSYGQPQGYAAPPAPFGYNPYAPPAAPVQAPAASPSAYGDAAGEHLHMKRGRYSAWPYVVIAFVGEAGLVGGIPGMLLGVAARAAGAPRDAASLITLVATFLCGLPVAYLVFKDRWKCNEAFSSRFCIGVMNVSILFVPIIAFVYANVRAAQKLAGK